MRVTVQLQPSDLYDVSIGFCDMNRKSKTFLDWISLEDVKGIDAEQLFELMQRLAKRA